MASLRFLHVISVICILLQRSQFAFAKEGDDYNYEYDYDYDYDYHEFGEKIEDEKQCDTPPSIGKCTISFCIFESEKGGKERERQTHMNNTIPLFQT